MIADIYKVGPLTYPKIFQCDNGSEFKGDVTEMLEKNEVKIRRVTTKYKHTHTAFVEALNKILAEMLFKVQDAQELNHPEKVSSRWVKHLYRLVDELNDTETEMIGMKPKDAIKLKEVPLVARESYPPEEVLPEDGLYRYHIDFHIIGDGIDIEVLLFSFLICISMVISYFSNLLHYEVAIVSMEIMEYNGYLKVFRFDPQF